MSRRRRVHDEGRGLDILDEPESSIGRRPAEIERPVPRGRTATEAGRDAFPRAPSEPMKRGDRPFEEPR